MRALTISAILAIFDSILRVSPVDPEESPLILSELLADDGGYAMDTGVCQNHQPLTSVLSRLELFDPAHNEARDEIHAYFQWRAQTCAHRLFDIRQPDNFEFNK